jgi:non-homologous end joining protein Ku
MLPGGCQVVYRDKNRLDKNRLDKNNIYTPFEVETSSGDSSTAKASKHKYGKYKHVLLKDEELQKLQTEYENYEELIDFLDEYIEMKGYKAKSHYLCIKKWVVDAVKQDHIRKGKYEATPTWKAESDNSWEEFRKSVGGDTNDTG